MEKSAFLFENKKIFIIFSEISNKIKIFIFSMANYGFRPFNPPLNYKVAFNEAGLIW